MTTPPTISDTPETPQRRSRLSIVGLVLCVIAFGLLFVPSFGPILAFLCAGTGFWFCIPKAIRNRKDKNRKDNITNFGLGLNVVFAVIAFIMAVSNIEDTATNDGQSASPRTDQSCEELAQIIHDGEKRGLSYGEIYAIMLKGASEAKVNAELDRCEAYFTSK